MIDMAVLMAMGRAVTAAYPAWDDDTVKRYLLEVRDRGDNATGLVVCGLVAAYLKATPSTLKDPAVWARAKSVTGYKEPGVEGKEARRQAACQVCGLDRLRCEATWSRDHKFESIREARARRAATERAKA